MEYVLYIFQSSRCVLILKQTKQSVSQIGYLQVVQLCSVSNYISFKKLRNWCVCNRSI